MDIKECLSDCLQESLPPDDADDDDDEADAARDNIPLAFDGGTYFQQHWSFTRTPSWANKRLRTTSTDFCGS